MSNADTPQIYLSTPPQFDLAAFSDILASALDAVPVACLRLSLATRDEDTLSRSADTLRAVAHARDVPLVIDTHFRLVEPLGLDGAHLPDGAARVREVRKALGQDAIVGAFCGASRHAGMTAGECGADYIGFGPVTASPHIGDGTLAEADLFAWWSEMIELPVVAEGGVTDAQVLALRPYVDFFCLGEEVWGEDDPLAALRRIAALIAG